MTCRVLVHKNLSNTIMSSLIRCVWYDIMNTVLQHNWHQYNSQAPGHVSHRAVLTRTLWAWWLMDRALEFYLRSFTFNLRLMN